MVVTYKNTVFVNVLNQIQYLATPCAICLLAYPLVMYLHTIFGEALQYTHTPYILCTYACVELYSIRHISVGPSAAPQNINTMVINSSAISVSWYPPPFLDQNGDIIGYQLMITNQNRSNSSVMVVNVTNETSYIATMLQEFEVYSFEIAAQTAIGLGPFSDAVSNQTFEDG